MCKKIETNENFFSLGEILVREISPELLKQESETGDILGCNATGEKILTTTGYGNLNVRSSNLSGREPLIDFARNQIYQRIRRGDSIVIIDPERRLHTREMWIYLTIHGYCVDSYDLDCMDGSCCFNCLSGFDKKLRKEDLDLIQRIANDIINDQRHNVPFAVDKISKILLSAVMIAAITEMEEKDRNMVEIATIFRLGVSGIMLDKILHVMFDEIDISHPGKKLFEIYSEAPVGIKLYAIQRVADALKVYEDYISENFKLHQYDMAMPIKQKCVLFVTPGKTAQDKVLFSSFMEKLYDMMIAAADLNPKHPKVQVDLFDYPLHGVIEGLDDYMKYGNDKGIYTTLYTECKDIETIDQEECMEHINEIYDHCKIDILIEDTDSSLHYTHKCGNTTIGEEPEIPGMSCHSNDPKYREIIKCKDNEDAIECHCYMYRSENHPYPIPENTEDLLTMYSKRSIDMKKDNIKQNFRKPVGRDLEIVSEDMLKEKDVTGNIIGYDKLYNLIILQRKNGNLYVESGAGRNPIYDFEKNLIYQSVRREDSIVITDPEREICTEQMQDYLMKHGYAIKIYNAESMRKTQDMISVDSLTKEKTIWFIVTRQYHKDQSVFRTFMGNLYKSLITSAENAKMRSNVQMILFGYPMYGRIEGILEYMEHGKAAGIYTAICTKDWIMRGPADREWLKIKKDNEKYKICRNSDITMYVGLRGFFDIDDGESDPWKDKTYEDFYIGGYFISRYEQDAGIYYKNSKGEKIEDAGCNQYMSKKNPYGIQKT